MNYMNMVKFIWAATDESVAVAYFQEREEIFNKDNNLVDIVPSFILIEAMFQTAGRIAREYSHNIYGGIIVGFSDFSFSRPIFADEQLIIRSKMLSYNDKSKVFYFQVTLQIDEEIILPQGRIIIKQVEQIVSGYLNNGIKISVEQNLDRIGYM